MFLLHRDYTPKAGLLSLGNTVTHAGGYLQGSSRLMTRPARVGSGIFSNLTGRVGSGQEIFKLSRTGSGHPYPNRPDTIRPDPRGFTRLVNSPWTFVTIVDSVRWRKAKPKQVKSGGISGRTARICQKPSTFYGVPGFISPAQKYIMSYFHGRTLQYILLRGTIVNRTYGIHKTPIYLTVFTNKIWSY